MRARAVLLAAAPLLAAPATAPPPPSGSVSGRVTITKNGKAQSCDGAVVYLADEPSLAGNGQTRAVIRQKNRRFVPDLTVVVRGTRIDFPNEDNINHNVFSASRPARDLDFREYTSEVPSYTFKVAGQVDLGCHIHADMAAKIFVVPNRYYARVGDSCQFKIDGVPPGAHDLVAWSGNKDILNKKKIVVEAGKTTEHVDFAIRKTGP